MARTPSLHIGFVSTRLAGTDGVSLETAKWVHVLEALGHQSFCFAGESDWPADRTRVVPEAHFEHPEIRAIQTDLFGQDRRSRQTSQAVQSLHNHLKTHLGAFVQAFDIDLLIVENALAIPMNVPLGTAITELIAETALPTIAHHHDFAWERQRFAITAASDYQLGAFPPVLPSVHHVVINSAAARQLALRTGLSSTLIPNVMDYATPPPPPDEYATGLRAELEIDPDHYLILQPTRIVPRKRIERAIELTRRLELPCTLVISHPAGDEGLAYQDYLLEYAHLLGVDLRLAAGRVAPQRGRTAEDRPLYSLADAYQAADLVTYPSVIEGFGNAFLEAVYYRRPLAVNAYPVYRRDIRPHGFRVIEFDDLITRETVDQARSVLQDQALADAMVRHNYELGRRHYSYQLLEQRLAPLLECCMQT
jgi:glycosyltransferase involved in cell wall biosynthesis